MGLGVGVGVGVGLALTLTLTLALTNQVNRVMSNSFGFGGTNACLVFDKYTE